MILITAIQSILKILKLKMMHHPIKSSRKRISSSVDMVQTVISDCMSLNCDLDLEHNFSFHLTLWPMMMHHNTRSSYETFRSSEDITWTDTETVNICCDLHLKNSNQIFF